MVILLTSHNFFTFKGPLLPVSTSQDLVHPPEQGCQFLISSIILHATFIIDCFPVSCYMPVQHLAWQTVTSIRWVYHMILYHTRCYIRRTVVMAKIRTVHVLNTNLRLTLRPTCSDILWFFLLQLLNSTLLTADMFILCTK
jgi:hypothetical protein